jgi:myosin III
VEEQVSELIKYRFYDNKITVDNLMNKPNGLFFIIDDLSKRRKLHINITETIAQNRSVFVKRVSDDEFSVSHYSGKILYDARDFIEKNQDFVPIEMIETMRQSAYELPKLMFKNRLTRLGHLTVASVEQEKKPEDANKPKDNKVKDNKAKKKWGNILAAEKEKSARNPHKMNTVTQGEYSQTTRMRTIASIFRTTSLDLLRNLSNCHAGTHFVRCFRADLDYRQGGFHSEMVRQQIRAMAIYDTTKARQQGYPHRIPFADFITRYQFLAFDFDETVELTKDNCRLMLLRLKMEGWMIGNTKVFLRYYNVEYLSR